MAGAEALIGGMLNGFVGSKQAAQQNAAMNEYRKVMADHIKTQAKLDEQKLNLMMMKSQGLPPELMNALNNIEGGGGPGPQAGMPQVNQPNVPPIAQVPQQPSLPQMMAGQQLSGAMGNVNIPMDRSKSGLSLPNNNPGNLVFVGQPGAVPGQGHGASPFAKFPTPEAGWNALLNQVQLDQSRGHTVGSFINKYAPPSENDTGTYIKNMTQRLGVTPETPLSAIPTADVAKGLAWFESQTTIGGGGQTPQQQPSTPPPPMFPRKTGIQALPLGTRVNLDVWFKQTYDLDTKFRDNKGDYQLKGDPFTGFQIFNKDKGIIEYALPPVQGKMEPFTVTMPNGAQVMQYRPSQIVAPLQGGIPGAVGGATQISPPEYNYQEITGPTGSKVKVAVPKAQPGASFPTEPEGVKISDAGRVNMVMQANNRMNEINDMLFPEDKINRSLILKATAPGGGLGEGSQLYSKMYQTVDSALRLETGAQANAQEIETKMREYWPSWKDTDATIKQKMKDLNEYVKGVVDLNDPTGEIRKMRGKTANPLATTSKTKNGGLPAGAKPTGRTSGGKPVYQLPDGQFWVQ